MKKFYCSESELLNTLGEEGKDWEYIDYIEGCLQDSFIIGAENATIFAFEHYLTCWSSDLEVYVASEKDNTNELYTRFEELKSLLESFK